MKRFWWIQKPTDNTLDNKSKINTINEETKNMPSSDEKWILDMQRAHFEHNLNELKAGTSSILSTGSVVTISSESEQDIEGLTSILKKSISNAKNLKRVSFAI